MAGSDDTIFAFASGAGRSAIGVIRLSGPRTRFVLETIARALPPPRKLALRILRDGEGRHLDQALVAWMPGPTSFTGEDQAELHIHGGLAIRAGVIQTLSRIEGCRAAEPGEFTRRAFLNERMDLSGVEGLADLIDAETEAQRRQALRQLEGSLGQSVEAWRERLIGALAWLEAGLDFADEEDVAADLQARAGAVLRGVAQEIGATLKDGARGERLREGFTVVIAGPPNAGKSTLLNALARRDVAIVSPIPGTTRDAIELRCDIGGLPVTFVDTAGLRDTSDPIEHEGVTRAAARMRAADLVLWLRAPDIGDSAPPGEGCAPRIEVAAKADLGRVDDGSLPVSALTGQGMDALLDRIGHAARSELGSGDALITRERHRIALERCREGLVRSCGALVQRQDELAAEDARLALRALGQITGRVDVEHVLDKIFASFCIGK